MAGLVGSWSALAAGTLPNGTSAPGAGSNRKLVHVLFGEKANAQTVSAFTVGGRTYDESYDFFLESGGSGDLHIKVFIWNEVSIGLMSGSTISFAGVSSGTGWSWMYATIDDCDQSASPFSSGGSVSAVEQSVSMVSTGNDYSVGVMVIGSANRAPLTDNTLTEIDEYSVSGHCSRLSAGAVSASSVLFEGDKVANNTIAAATIVFQDPSSGPILSDATDDENGQNASTASVTTDTESGTIYAVVTTSATTPSHAQIVAGQDHTGAAAVDSDSAAAVAGAGANTFGFGAQSAGTQYYTHFAQDDTIDATPVSADGYITQSSAPTLSLPTLTATGSSTATGDCESDSDGGQMTGVITTSATTPSSAQILAGQDHTGAAAVAVNTIVGANAVNNFSWTGLSPSTVYYAHYAQAGTTPATPVTSSSVTTTANQAPVLDTPIPDQVCTIGVAFGPLDVSVYFSDPDGDNLTYSASGLPVGLTISSAGVISGTPTGGYNP